MPSQLISFRFSEPQVQALKSYAQFEGESINLIAQRLLTNLLTDVGNIVSADKKTTTPSVDREWVEELVRGYYSEAMLQTNEAIRQLREEIPAIVNEAVNEAVNTQPRTKQDEDGEAKPDIKLVSADTPTLTARTKLKLEQSIDKPDIDFSAKPVNGSADKAPRALKQGELAARLGVHSSSLLRRRDRLDFLAWSASKDPDKLAWLYDSQIGIYHHVEGYL